MTTARAARAGAASAGGEAPPRATGRPRGFVWSCRTSMLLTPWRRLADPVSPDAPGQRGQRDRLTLRQRVNMVLFERLRALLARRGYWIIGNKVIPPDYDPEIVALFKQIEFYTLTSHERVLALRDAVRYIVKAEIPGAIVECGVWRGGSMLAIAHTLVDLGVTDRDLYLFDTFETMPHPGEHDIDVWGGKAADTLDQALASPVFAYIPQDEIHRLMLETGYPDSRL